MKTKQYIPAIFLLVLSLACSSMGAITELVTDSDVPSMIEGASTTVMGDEEGIVQASAENVPVDEVPAPQYDESYYLFSPIRSTDTYLMDVDGTIAFTWQSDYPPGNAVYLLENGNILRTGTLRSQVFSAGGAGGIVQEITPESEVVWEYQYASDTVQQHHDIEHLPNGNILMIAWELKTEAEAIAAGRDPSLLGDGVLWSDHIIEVDPDSNQIVWEWHAWDHLVQDHDADLSNYGVVAEHPELVDLNYTSGKAGEDWLHSNSIDYNAELDQILLSVHNFSEIWLIDHSISTEEAAGSAGDLLYRWGNPQTYDAGSEDEQQLFGQHDAQWIAEGDPGGGNILVFNNGDKRTRKFSSVDEIVLPLNEDGSYAGAAGRAYGPEAAVWSYVADVPGEFYAMNISGAQRLNNGNTLICSGPDGLFFEVTPDGDSVWQHEYGGPVFRVTEISGGHPALPILIPFGSAAMTESASGNDVNLDTGQVNCYDDQNIIPCPQEGEAFYGQDAQYASAQLYYVDNGDGTVTDVNTGLMWIQAPGEKMAYYDAVDSAESFSFAGYDDWRVPTIKELYSLMDFSGIDDAVTGTDPFIDADIFVFEYGDPSKGEREIDSQWVTSSIYTGSVMNGRECFFGVNFADGRIKCYPTSANRNNGYFLRLVRGTESYGENDFVDNGDGTVSDRTTGLTWQQVDSGEGVDWGDALASCESLELAGQDDWRLPNAKELQYIVDYDRGPDETNSAAIDPLFSVSSIVNEAGQDDYPFYWSSTTHANARGGQSAVYVSFGRAMGYMNGIWMDVHGAGAQRSDPKSGDPADYPTGMGPQGDARRIDNYVRCVRGGTDGEAFTGGDVEKTQEQQPPA